MSLVEFKNVCKSFDKKQILKDVSFTIESGKIVGLLGKNGMGKTTILNCLYCVLSGNVENLSTVIFEEITLTLSDNQKFSLNI